MPPTINGANIKETRECNYMTTPTLVGPATYLEQDLDNPVAHGMIAVTRGGARTRGVRIIGQVLLHMTNIPMASQASAGGVQCGLT